MYIEVLYTIANTVGASTGQYAHYKEDLYRYAQEAFGVPQDQHRRYLNIASEEKVTCPPFFSFFLLFISPLYIDFILKSTPLGAIAFSPRQKRRRGGGEGAICMYSVRRSSKR